MARDYEDLHDIDALDDRELHDLIRQEMEDMPELDPDDVEVHVADGAVTLAGRVGTEQELQQVEALVADVLGIRNYRNELVVDELVRGEAPAAADVAVEERPIDVETQLGDTGDRTSDTADHLIEDLEAESHGTQDPGKATERGLSYEPPTRPVQEGHRSAEDH
jgi:hypothetical protein